MNIETTFFKATDGVDLKGVIYKTQSKTNKVLISIHGMATNCLKERDEKIAEKANELNIDFFAFNNRGHDIVNYIKKENQEKQELAGTAYEEISESYNDIVGAINYATSHGYEEIYIMGHSLGCTKTIYTYNKLIEEKQEKRININLTNNMSSTKAQNSSAVSTSAKVENKRPDVKISQKAIENSEKRQINNGLRDLIQILLIRELLNRQRPPFRPPMPNPPGPGPRPPMRPPFRPGPGRPPFNRDFGSYNDLYEQF